MPHPLVRSILASILIYSTYTAMYISQEKQDLDVHIIGK